jgi:hypothetical protein
MSAIFGSISMRKNQYCRVACQTATKFNSFRNTNKALLTFYGVYERKQKATYEFGGRRSCG